MSNEKKRRVCVKYKEACACVLSPHPSNPDGSLHRLVHVRGTPSWVTRGKSTRNICNSVVLRKYEVLRISYKYFVYAYIYSLQTRERNKTG